MTDEDIERLEYEGGPAPGVLQSWQQPGYKEQIEKLLKKESSGKKKKNIPKKELNPKEKYQTTT